MLNLFRVVRLALGVGKVLAALQILDFATSVLHKVLDLFDRVRAYFKPNREVVVYGL